MTETQAMARVRADLQRQIDALRAGLRRLEHPMQRVFMAVEGDAADGTFREVVASGATGMADLEPGRAVDDTADAEILLRDPTVGTGGDARPAIPVLAYRNGAKAAYVRMSGGAGGEVVKFTGSAAGVGMYTGLLTLKPIADVDPAVDVAFDDGATEIVIQNTLELGATDVAWVANGTYATAVYRRTNADGKPVYATSVARVESFEDVTINESECVAGELVQTPITFKGWVEPEAR